MTNPVGLRCPGCHQPPALVLNGGRQAFCGTDVCRVFTWNPTETIDELLEGLKVIDLSMESG